MRDVARTAEAELLVLEPHDRHWRFRRDALDAADDEVVEHDIADDENGAASEALCEIGRRAGHQAACRWASDGAVVAGTRSAA